MINCFMKMMRSTSGTTAIEYGLIGTLISVSIIASAIIVGGNVETMFTGVGEDVESAVN